MLKVVHSVSKMDRAGQETFIMNLFRKIDREAIQFDFLCSDHSKADYDDEIYALGGHIYYLPPITARGPLKQFQKMGALIRALREHPCDVYHIHTHHAMDAFRDAVAAKLAGVKTVAVHSHNTSALFHLGAHRFFRHCLALLPIRRFACSQAAGAWMFTRDNFTVLHNGMDTDAVCYQPQIRADVRKAFGWEDKKVIGHVGRFNAQKNHKFLIEVFSQIHSRQPDTQLVLMGKGELEEEIRSLVASKGLEDAVSFLGVRDDVQKLYQGMDLFLFPSLFEGLGIVLIEAQACDLPCLISDVIPKEAILTDKVSAKALEESAESWAMEAIRLLENTDSRRDNRQVMRRAGYDIGDLAQNLESIYLKK